MTNLEFDTGMSYLDSDDDFLGPAHGEDGLVRCVFSSMEKVKVGTGTTTRRHITKLYWYVEELEGKQFAVRKLNARYVPVGEEKIVSVEDLAEHYLPEVEFWEEKTLPAMNELEMHLEDGEHEVEEGRFYSAERSFNKALCIDERNVRALFNLGLIYMELEIRDKARDVMAELLKIKSSFLGKNQHLFNEFGIALRKQGMYDEAVTYYRRALDYIHDDENLYYNIARAHYEQGDWEGCFCMLDKSCQLAPDLPPSRDLANVLAELVNKPWLCEREGKPPIPRELAESIRAGRKPGAGVDLMDVERGDVLRPQRGHARSSGVFPDDPEK